MYFWNVKALSEELRSNTISEFEKIKYLIVLEVAFTLILAYPIVEEFTIFILLEMLMGLVASVFGTYYLFNINSKGDGKAFIERYICLGFPVAIRSIILAFVAMIIIEILLFIAEILSLISEDSINEDVVTLILGLGFFLYYYKYLGFWIRKTSEDLLTAG